MRRACLFLVVSSSSLFVAGLATVEGGLGSGEQCSTGAQQPRLTALAGAEPRRLCR